MKKYVYLIGITVLEEDNYAAMTPKLGQGYLVKTFVLPEALLGTAEDVARYASQQVQLITARVESETTLPSVDIDALEFLGDLIIEPSVVTRGGALLQWASYADWADTKSLLTVEEAFEAGRAMMR